MEDVIITAIIFYAIAMLGFGIYLIIDLLFSCKFYLKKVNADVYEESEDKALSILQKDSLINIRKVKTEERKDRMKLVIDIPEKDIPKNLGTMEINLSFCNGKLCQCDYPFETDIEHMSSVSTEKTAHWIYKTIRGEEVPCCSRCGLDNGTYYEFNYCPECGANMIEPQESEGEK